MSDRITPEQFLAAEGLDDWRVLPDGQVAAYFATRNFAAGIGLVNEIGRLADDANHHPDVDLRYKGVTVRVSSNDIGGLSHRDVHLARQISAAAHDLGIPADPKALQA